MAKELKKKPRIRLKKQVRRTLGGIFLASAVAVAAIPAGSRPAGEVEAANACNGTNINEYYLTMTDTGASTQTPQTKVPFIQSGTQVYSTGGGEFQFVYVNQDGKDIAGEANKFAVILGFNSGYLQGGALDIPNTVDVYKQLNDNNLAQGNCLVGKSGNFLYYVESEVTTPTVNIGEANITGTLASQEPFANDKSTNYLDSYFAYTVGDELYDLLVKYDKSYDYLTKTPNVIKVSNVSMVEDKNDPDNPDRVTSYTYKYEIEHLYYKPCLYSTRTAWESLAADQLFWHDTATVGLTDAQRWKKADESAYQKVEGIEVRYIGNQYVTYDTTKNDYVIAGAVTSSTGIFAGDKGANIKTLTTHENLAGIGDYAFYNCVALTSISFENGLIAIGNHAFSGCRALSTVNMPDAPKLQNIGA